MNLTTIQFTHPIVTQPAFIFGDRVALHSPGCDRSQWLTGEIIGMQILRGNKWLYIVEMANTNGFAEECFEEDLEALIPVAIPC